MSEAELAEKIDRQRVEELTTKFQEPAWLRENRLQSWESYLQIPMPTNKDEAWRRTDLTKLDLTKLRAFNLSRATQVEKVPSAPQWFMSAVEHFENNAGVLFQTTKNGGYLQLRKDLADKGVIFCDLGTAIENHQDKIQPYLVKERAQGKFTVLNQALFNCGMFLYVPKNVEIKEPFVFGLGFSVHADDIAHGGAIFPRLIVVAEDNSRADVVCVMGTEDDVPFVGEQLSLASSNADITVKGGAKVNFLAVHQFSSDVFFVEDVASHVSRDGLFNSLSLAVGGNQTKSDIATYLDAPGASSCVLGAVLGSDNEYFNFNTIQEHNAPDTKSNINFRVAVKDNSSSVYRGIIKVAQEAQRTDAYQSNKNLILGGDATADSVPKLEILANDVKCSHGATVGPVDREQIFYLMSRGLTRTESEELVVLGFFRQVLEQVEIEKAAEWLEQIVSTKVFR